MTDDNCSHGMYDRDMRCVRCGATVACAHYKSYVLQLPPFHVGEAALELRQCDWCKRIGVVDQHDEIVWMREVAT